MDASLRELERRALSGDPRACALYVAALKRSTAGLSVDDIKALKEAIDGELRTVEFSFNFFGARLADHRLHHDGRNLQKHLEDLRSDVISRGRPDGYQVVDILARHLLSYQSGEGQQAYFSTVEDKCLCPPNNCICPQVAVDGASLPEPGKRYFLLTAPLGEPPPPSLPAFIIQFSTEQIQVPCGENVTLHSAMRQYAAFLGYDGGSPLTWRMRGSPHIISGETVGQADATYHAHIHSMWD